MTLYINLGVNKGFESVICVSGETYKVKESLKELGFQFQAGPEADWMSDAGPYWRIADTEENRQMVTDELPKLLEGGYAAGLAALLNRLFS